MAIRIALSLVLAAVLSLFLVVSSGEPRAACFGVSPPSLCPQGTSYVGVGDGCQGAQATGTVQHTNFYTGYTGVSYATRPPWNEPGVDYPVGYDGGALTDFNVTMPPCGAYWIDGAHTFMGLVVPTNGTCTIDHYDFSLHGGICITATGNTGSNVGTLIFTNNKFGPPNIQGGSGQCNFTTWVSVEAGYNINVLMKYNTIQDGYSNTGVFFSAGAGGGQPTTVTFQYNGFVQIGARCVNLPSQATLIWEYNAVFGIGTNTQGLHGEPYEFGGGSTPAASMASVTDMFNVIYLDPSNLNTGLDYIATGLNTGSGDNANGTLIQGTVEYNTLVARPNPGDSGISTSAMVWVQTTQNVVVTSIVDSHNYMDPSGSYAGRYPAYVYPPDGHGGSITGSTNTCTGANQNCCTGNVNLIDGSALTGTFGSGSSTIICN